MLDYVKYPIVKHLAWFTFTVALGLTIGAQLYQWQYLAAFDTIYMLANAGSSLEYSLTIQISLIGRCMCLVLLACVASLIYSIGFIKVFKCG